MRPDPLIFVSAGEASGDHYGSQIIGGLLCESPSAQFVGLGGSQMRMAGQRQIIRAEDVAFMGITEIVRHVPTIYRGYRKLVRVLHTERPNAAVLIDFPDVNFRLAKHCKQLGIPVIWVVSPQLWAWKRKRLRWVQERVSQMLTIFPFEETFYRARGVNATFIGHPLAEAPPPDISREEYALRAMDIEQRQWSRSDNANQPDPRQGWKPNTSTPPLRYALRPDKPWVALLPGSRQGEIAANLPALVDSAKLLGSEYEFLVPLAPGATDVQIKFMQRTIASHLNAKPSPRVTLVRDAQAALLHSRAAAVASGTATVQAAVLGTPFVTVYRVSDLTFRAAKRLVTYPPEVVASRDESGNLPVAMPNLIAGRRVTRELLQDQFTAERVAAVLGSLVRDGPPRDAAISGLQEVRDALLLPGEQTAVERVCRSILQELASVR